MDYSSKDWGQSPELASPGILQAGPVPPLQCPIVPPKNASNLMAGWCIMLLLNGIPYLSVSEASVVRSQLRTRCRNERYAVGSMDIWEATSQ